MLTFRGIFYFILITFGIVATIIVVLGVNKRKKDLYAMKQDFLAKGYQVTHEITHRSPLYGAVATVLLDSYNGVLCVLSGNINQPRYIRFSELLGCDVIVNRQSVSSVGRAVTGGLLFGPIGAIVASQTGKKNMIDRFEVYIYTNNPNNPRVEVFKMTDKSFNYDSPAARQAIQFAEELQASVNSIVEMNRSHQ